jgi:hypothetical protein
MKSSIARRTVHVLALFAAFGAGAAFAGDEPGALPATGDYPQRQGMPTTEAPQAPDDMTAPTTTSSSGTRAAESMRGRQATGDKPAWLDNEAPVNGIFAQE